MEENTGAKFIEYAIPSDESGDGIENSFRQYQKKIVEFPADAENYFKLATLFISKDKIADAISMLEQCLKRNPEHNEAYFLLGNSYIRHDQFELAARYYLKALKINPNHAPSLFNIGLCFTMLNFPKKAINAFKKFFMIESSSKWREEAKYQLYKLGVKV